MCVPQWPDANDPYSRWHNLNHATWQVRINEGGVYALEAPELAFFTSCLIRKLRWPVVSAVGGKAACRPAVGATKSWNLFGRNGGAPSHCMAMDAIAGRHGDMLT